MRALITGSSGQLGRDLASHCVSQGDEVFAFDRTQLDLTDGEMVSRVISETRPDVVFNCGAWTAVDDCEADPVRANAVNGSAVESLARAAKSCDAHLVQISTDYVFDGSKPTAYCETDPPNPTSAYGRSKLLGEFNAGAESTIVRTSWVYSAHGNNMVATICRLAKSHPVLRFVSDQVGRPTFTRDLAAAARRLGDGRATGIWHCANAGPVSWFEFAGEVLCALGEDPSRVVPIATADLDPPRPAPRPANSVLGTGRFDQNFGPMSDFRENLGAVVASYD